MGLTLLLLMSQSALLFGNMELEEMPSSSNTLLSSLNAQRQKMAGMCKLASAAGHFYVCQSVKYTSTTPETGQPVPNGQSSASDGR